MSPDWWDPLGLRGRRLDPFTLFSDALRGEGIAQQATERLATGMARQLVGRRLAVESEPPIGAHIMQVDEVTPAIALAAMPSASGAVPVWRRVRGVVHDVTYGPHRFSEIGLSASSIVLRGPARSLLAIEQVDFVARVDAAQVQTWVAQLGGDQQVRLDRGRVEVSDRRVSKWGWIEVDLALVDGVVSIEPRQLDVRGRRLGLPARAKRPIRRDIEGLPDGLTVARVIAVDGVLEVTGSLTDLVLPVDVARLLSDLGSEGTRSALRVMMTTP